MATLQDTVTNTLGDDIQITTEQLTGEDPNIQQQRHDEALREAENGPI